MAGDNHIGSLETDAAITHQFASMLDAEDGDEDNISGEGEEPEENAGEEPEEGDTEGEDADAEEDGEEEEQPARERLYTVKVDGKEAQVPLSELTAGYQRQADYTRKSMALADQRKATEAEFQAVRAERAQFAQWAQGLLQQLQQNEPQVDWDRLKAEDPFGYATQWADYQRRQAHQQELHRQYQLAQQRNQQAEAAERQRILDTEGQRLAEAVPEFRDAQKAEQLQRALHAYGQSVGFSEEELGNVYDHRSVVVLRKAMLYDQMVARRQQVQPDRRPRGPVAAPGSNAPAAPNVTFKKQMHQLRKTGSTADAAAAFAALL